MINTKTNRLSEEEIKARGRMLLAKILKGSREKKVLQLELDKCPAYGYFKKEKLEEIMKKIDWMIDYDFLDIQYSGKLPMIIFTERGCDMGARHHKKTKCHICLSQKDKGKESSS